MQLHREVGPHAVEAAAPPRHRRGVGRDQPLDLPHRQLACGVLAGDESGAADRR